MLLYVLPADPAAAGVDIPRMITGIAAAVDAGRIPLATIDDDVRRLLVLRRTLSGQTGPFVPGG